MAVSAPGTASVANRGGLDGKHMGGKHLGCSTTRGGRGDRTDRRFHHAVAQGQGSRRRSVCRPAPRRERHQSSTGRPDRHLNRWGGFVRKGGSGAPAARVNRREAALTWSSSSGSWP